LGSALKLRAAVLLKMPKPSWQEVSTSLGAAANAYASAVQGDKALSPYNTLNWLPLAWLAGTLDQTDQEAAALARRCGAEARRRFVGSKDLWDAIMSADAEMTAWLLSGAFQEVESEMQPADKRTPAVVMLQKLYEEAAQALPQSARQRDSVVKQWRLLARFLRLRNQRGDHKRADILDELADQYVPRPAEPKASAAKTKASAKPAASRKKPAPTKRATRRKKPN